MEKLLNLTLNEIVKPMARRTWVFVCDNLFSPTFLGIIMDGLNLFDLAGKTEYIYANVMEPSRYALEVSA